MKNLPPELTAAFIILAAAALSALAAFLYAIVALIKAWTVRRNSESKLKAAELDSETTNEQAKNKLMLDRLSQVDRLELTVQTQTKVVSDLTELVQRHDRDHVKEIGVLSGELKATQRQLEEANVRITDLSEYKLTAQNAVIQARGERDAAAIDRDTERTARQKVENDYNDLKAQVKSLSEQVIALVTDNISLRAELDELRDEHHQARNEWTTEELARHNETTRIKRAFLIAQKFFSPEQVDSMKAELARHKISLSDLLIGDPNKPADPLADPYVALDTTMTTETAGAVAATQTMPTVLTLDEADMPVVLTLEKADSPTVQS